MGKPAESEPADSERVVILAPRGRDAALTVSVLARHGLRAEICRDPDHWFAAISAGAGCALITQEELAHGVHSRLAAVLAKQPPWSDFPLLVLAGATRVPERALAAFADLGNVTLIDRPVAGQILVAAVRSVLRARRRQYDARAAIAQRDQFLAMLGHELRNPLGAIVLAAELVEGAAAPPEVLTKRIDTIGRQAHHLARLVDDLLDVARVTSGKVRLRREPLEIDRTIAGCIEALAGFGKARGISVVFEPGGCPRISGDGVRLEQIFSNLITNAIKYSPDGSTITITTGMVHDSCEVRVRDRGIGIAPEMSSRIFELFTQVDGAIDRSHGGMGIGLTLVKRLVELHDGTIEVHSAGLGTGSEFVVRLPCGGRTRPMTPIAVPIVAPSPSPVRVVLVDDNDDIRELGRAVLEKLGCEVHDAADGPSGLAQILETEPDLALVDIGLPGIDGFGVATAVRSQLGPKPLLVAVTGYGQPQDQRQAIAAGFDVHLTKPVRTDALRAMVEQARARRAHAEVDVTRSS